MATIEGRDVQRAQAIASILPQLDVLYVHCNSCRPPLPGDCIPLFGPDRGDAGKFWAAWHCPAGTDLFTLDDDLVYPPDYCDVLSTFRETCGRSAVSAHGARLKFPIMSYLDRDVRRCLAQVKGIRAEHMLGTGVMHFRATDIELTPDSFETGAMADVWFAIEAQRQALPLRSIPHEEDWVRLAEPPPNDTLWKRMKRGDRGRAQIAALRRVQDWKLY